MVEHSSLNFVQSPLQSTSLPLISQDLRCKVLIFGEPASGKSSLVNQIRTRPMKLSGAELVAGYCMYNERLTLA